MSLWEFTRKTSTHRLINTEMLMYYNTEIRWKNLRLVKKALKRVGTYIADYIAPEHTLKHTINEYGHYGQ